MDLRTVDLNSLVALDALLSECSVTRAAERLGIGQPAMSAALARLRKLFDDQLLIKDGRGLRQTQLGESLVVPLREVLQTVDGLLSRSTDFDPGTARRTFRLIASDYVAVTFVGVLLAHLQRLAPNIRLMVEPIHPAYQVLLRAGAVDFVIMPREVVNNPLQFGQIPLYEDSYVAAVWEHHPEVGERLTLEQMRTLPYLAWQPAGGQPALIDTLLDREGMTRKVEVATGGLLSAPFMLAGTRLYTMLERRLARRVLGQTEIRLVEAAVPLAPFQENLYWPRDRTNDVGHRWLREQIALVASNLDSDDPADPADPEHQGR